MSRATFTIVFRADGESAVASSAQASSIPRLVVATMAAAGTVAAAPFRKFRRLNLLRGSTSLMSHPPFAGVGLLAFLLPSFLLRSVEAAAFLNDLDLVAIGIGGEEEPRQRSAVVLQFAQRTRLKIFAFEAGMLGGEVIDHHRDMAVAVAEIVGRGAIQVHRQFDLER